MAPRSFRPVSHPRPCSMTAPCRPLLRSESTGARPFLRTGRRALFRRARLRPARLHEARFAVFALRVTIPVAFAPFGRCALRLRVRSLSPCMTAAVARSLRSHRRRLSPTSGTRASRRVASLPPPLALASPPFGGPQSPSASQQARRYRAIAVAPPLSLYLPKHKSATAHRSSSDIALIAPGASRHGAQNGSLPEYVPAAIRHGLRRLACQAARPFRGRLSSSSPRSRCLVLSALRASARP